MQKITPFLWFNNNAEEAANFYVSIFKNSKIGRVTRCGDAGPGPKGSVLLIEFELEGQQLMALNGGPMFKLTEAFSLYVDCQTQAEVDDLWAKLSAGGETHACGWLKDKFGVSWQIIPRTLIECLNHPDPAKAKNAMLAMQQMVKIDIQKLKDACA